MNHYDGPAFYRKFVHEGTINKNHKLNALRTEKQRYSQQSSGVTGFSRDLQRANFGNFKPTKTKASQIDLQNNPIARITANFKPRRHYGTPDRSTTYVSKAPNEFERITNHYHRLTSELTPNDGQVTLLASSGDNLVSNSASQREGALHFKFGSTSANNSDESQAQALNQQPKNFNRITNNSIENSNKSDHKGAPNTRVGRDQSQGSGLNNSFVASEDSSSDKSESFDSVQIDKSDKERLNLGASMTSNLSDKNSKLDQSSSELSSEGSVRSSQSASDQGNSSESKSSTEPLGHDFSSIMHDEGEDIKKNLTLFNKSNSSDVQSDVNAARHSGEESEITNSANTDETADNSNSSVNDEVNDNQSTSLKDQPSGFDHHPDFVSQNPTNVQPSTDFDDSDSEDEEHHNIQPSVIENYKFPSHQLLVAPKHYNDQGLDNWILDKAEVLNKTLRAFNVNAQVVDWTNGPTVTQFQVKLHLGVKVSKINHLSDDLKMALAAKDIRIQAPIPGKTTCGIEIPNPKPRPVMLSEVVNSKTFKNSKSDLTIALGVDLTGKPRVTDLRKMPHGLIAGATGSGKSVFINCMLVSLMYKATPQELKMILIDPKAVEFAPYNGIPYLLSPVISEPKQAAASLKWATKEMNQRYEKLAAAGVRNIEQFNKKADDDHQPKMKMPYILIVIDELADLMMVAGDEIETYIVRITQKARAAGIHLVVATQRPSVDVITGTMKNNIPTRVAFMVSSQVDSRTIIDQSGAERLLGKGDMLYLGNGSSHPIRLQGCYVSNQEIDKVAGFARHQEPAHYAFHPGSLLKHVSQIENQDKLMPQVLAYIAKEKTVSTSKLQRVFSIGYNRAAKIIDDLEQHNYISGQEGSKPRDIYLTEADYKKLNL